jgi:hypothetical protein
MNNTVVKNLALFSYKDEKIDIKKVEQIVKILNKADFRKYIKYLKLVERSKTINIILSKKIDNKTEMLFKNKYRGKNINFTIDKNLILGFKILDNDFIYEYNLKDAFNKIEKFIIQ